MVSFFVFIMQYHSYNISLERGPSEIDYVEIFAISTFIRDFVHRLTRDGFFQEIFFKSKQVDPWTGDDLRSKTRKSYI